MKNLLKINLKNNKKSFIVTLILIFIINIKILSIHINPKFDLYSSGIYRWYELILPLAPLYLILSINEDIYSKDVIEYYYSLPLSIEKTFILKNILLCSLSFLLFLPSLYKLNFLIIQNFGPDSLPKGSLYLYVFENLFVLCSYSLTILIIFREIYFSIGFLVVYVLFDYFTESSFLNMLSIHSYTFKNYSTIQFITNRILVFLISLILFFLSYYILKKIKDL